MVTGVVEGVEATQTLLIGCAAAQAVSRRVEHDDMAQYSAEMSHASAETSTTHTIHRLNIFLLTSTGFNTPSHFTFNFTFNFSLALFKAPARSLLCRDKIGPYIF